MQLGEMQNEVNRFFKLLGVNTVQVEVRDENSTCAKALGFHLDLTLPLLNRYINWAWGTVYINVNLVNSILSNEEQKFILAHEVAHIRLNHVSSKLTHEVFNTALKQLAPIASITLDVLKLLSHLRGIPPPISALTKRQELDADVQAILLTGNKTAAINCLSKLVKGNLDAYSHEWEALGMKMPAMTVRERIAEIQRITNEISQHENVTFL